MNHPRRHLTAASFEVPNEAALRAYTDELFAASEECREHPGEETGLAVCRASRYVWDTVEGIIHTPSSLERALLRRAIQGIELGIQAVSAAKSAPGLSPQAMQHVGEVLEAMTERRDDLSVLLTQGEAVFSRRLRVGATVEA
jgi:hypothetical protein